MPESDAVVPLSPTARTAAVPLRTRALEHLLSTTETTAAELEAALEITNREARDALADLARAGKARRTARGIYIAAQPTTDPDERPASKRPWGSVSTAARNAIASAPGRHWTAEDLAAEIGVSDKHALVLLCSERRAGRLERVAPGVYAVPTVPPIAQPAHGARRVARTLTAVSATDDGLVLVDGEGAMWLAKPATLVAS